MSAPLSEQQLTDAKRWVEANLIDRILGRCVAGPQSCVLWTGAKNPKGYGQINFERRRVAVHRVAFVAFKGAIPAGLEIDHLCRVRNCVNPHHLEAVTHGENNRRSVRVPRIRAACLKGHAFTPDNVYRHKNGTRECRACKKARRGNSKASSGSVRNG